jgi:hypothetical protein
MHHLVVIGSIDLPKYEGSIAPPSSYGPAPAEADIMPTALLLAHPDLKT